jgi:Zn-dependent peptidase ImmA (M78 family)/DNA-binding XRE family transcriptional regulator
MFNPVRLTIARKRRQLTKKALAEEASVSQLTLTRLESGQTSDPSPETIAALASALNYPEQFFYMDDCEELRTEAVSFRSLSSLTSRQRDAALASGPIAFQLDDWISEKFNLPAQDLLDLRDESPVPAAAALRKHWGIGSKPIPHLLKLLEAKGIRVFSLSEKNKNVDAFSCWRGSTPYIFLNTFKSAERSRFDAAHELGHLVLHLHGASAGRDVEKEADQFAAAFLMPPEDVVSNLRKPVTISQLLEAKTRWGVSLTALARNAREADMISEWNYRDFCKTISAMGYRTREPNSRPREESVLWKKVFESLWRDRISKDHIAKQLAIPIDEIEGLLGGLYGDAGQGSAGTVSRKHLKVI